MILLTSELRDRLLANGRERDVDHIPVVKFFNPVGAATWLATELDDDGETLFGLADLGFGSPEIGAFNLVEMASVRLPFGLGIERDLYFEAAFPLSVYAEAARRAGRIVLDERRLREAAEALRERG
ncbi:MAG: DUF2958 domain-containing protein [Hyphomicrobiaceae bacterium]|jgi:hypothetical protein